MYGDATIDATVDTDLEKVVTLLMRILGLMVGKAMPESVREQTRQMALNERRVQLRVRPYATFESPPRHVYSSEDVADLTHIRRFANEVAHHSCDLVSYASQ